MDQIFSYKFTIKQIFQEHWDDYLSSPQNSVPDYVVSTVNKMLNCRNPPQSQPKFNSKSRTFFHSLKSEKINLHPLSFSDP